MSSYSNAFGETLKEIADSRGFRARVEQIDQVICFRLPEITFTARFKPNLSPRIDIGDSPLVPDLIVEMSGSTASSFFAGELNPFLAQRTGEIRFDGDPRSFLLVFPQVIDTVAPLHRARLDPETFITPGPPMKPDHSALAMALEEDENSAAGR